MSTPQIFRRFAVWGALPSERDAFSPADVAVVKADVHWVRGVDIDAAPDLIWEWLGQLRVAPYAYDWIDNFGHRSPQQLLPSLGKLAIGQPMLHAFHIVDFTTMRFVTIMLRTGSKFVVPYARSYVLTSSGGSASRLTVHIRARSPHGLFRHVGGAALGALSIVDFAMSRRELLNLKALAERDERVTKAGPEAVGGVPRSSHPHINDPDVRPVATRTGSEREDEITAELALAEASRPDDPLVAEDAAWRPSPASVWAYEARLRSLRDADAAFDDFAADVAASPQD